MDEHVIVVGGGIGGLCSGIYLSNKGFQVTIVEKNETLGGKINIINDTHIPVKNAQSRFYRYSVISTDLPAYFVVIFYLHHLIAFTVNHTGDFFFDFTV